MDGMAWQDIGTAFSARIEMCPVEWRRHLRIAKPCGAESARSLWSSRRLSIPEFDMGFALQSRISHALVLEVARWIRET